MMEKRLMKTRWLAIMLIFMAAATQTVYAALSPAVPSSGMFTVSGVVGGRVQFDKESGTVTGLESSVTEAVIPETIDGVTVTAIGDWATSSCAANLSKLVLPDTVTSVGQGLGQYSHITEFSLPSRLRSLPEYCFRYCDALTDVTIPGNIKTLNQCCFQGCSALKSVTLERGVAAIGKNCFENCPELTALSMPGTLKTIDSYAFRYCGLLESVTYDGKDFYPFDGAWDSTVSIGDFCFQTALFGHPDFSDSYKKGRWYQALHEITPTGDYLADLFAVAKSQLGYHEGNSLQDMSGANTRGTEDYAEYTYWWNEPGEMWCGEYVGWCFAMASVPMEIAELKYQTKDAAGEDKCFTWQDTSYAGGDAAYSLKKGDVILFKYSGGNHVVLVENVSVSGSTVTVQSINGNHSNDVSFDSYTIDASSGKTLDAWTSNNGYVNAIYSPDFSIAKDLTYYTVRFDMQGGNASWSQKRLTNNASYGVLPLPEKNGYTFDGWYTEPTGGTKITSYRRVRLRGDTTLYAHWRISFGKVKASEEKTDASGWKIDADGTITYIPYSWEGGRIPDRIQGIAPTAIGDWAASNRPAITELVIPGTVKTLGEGAFYGCDNLLSVVMEEGVETLNNMAFYSCDQLSSVKIPASMKKIGEGYGNVFNGCGQLLDVSFAGEPGKISYGLYTFVDTLFIRPDFSDAYKGSGYYQKLMAVEPSGDYMADTIAVAASQEGYHEGNSVEQMDGSNQKGAKDYAEMAYFTSSPSYKWWPYEKEYSYGGWCRNYCEWCMAMASMPEELHGFWDYGLRNNGYPTWTDTIYAGGSYEIKPGDVLHMNIGHYCIVTDVEMRGDQVLVSTWNGNDENDVGFYTNVFRASDGWNLSMEQAYGTRYGERYQVEEIIPYLPEKLSSVSFYTVSFNGNGGTVPKGRETKKLAASAYFGIMPVPVREGYRFDGWYTEPAGGIKITSYRKSALAKDTKLYAHWRPGR